MSDQACPYESAVVDAARTGEWPQSLQAHLCECAECADSARVASWLGEVATRLGRNRSAPDPSYLWLRAEIERRAQAEGALSWRRLGLVSLLGLGVSLAGAAATVAVLPKVLATVVAARVWLSGAWAAASAVDMAAIGTAWLGLPMLLAATYLLVLRPPR